MVCEAFNCTPSEALKQDARLVFSILEGRLAQGAKAQHNQDASKMTTGQKRIMVEMAQSAGEED